MSDIEPEYVWIYDDPHGPGCTCGRAERVRVPTKSGAAKNAAAVAGGLE